MSDRPPIPWSNHCMRKHGASIREKIAESYGVFAKAVATVEREQALDRLLREIPRERCGAA